jgi:hypothetical protein
MSEDWIKVHSEMDTAFQRGEVANADEAQLQRWLQNLCTGNVPNETVRHREIIRGLTINHIQMARTIRDLEGTMQKLNAANDKTQQLVVKLTRVAVVVGIIQAVVAVILLFR